MPRRCFAHARPAARWEPGIRRELRSSFQHTLQPTGDGLQYLDARIVLVLGFDQRPRCVLGAGAIDHVAYGLFVRVPFLAVAPIVRRDLEAFEGGLLARLEPSQLLGLADLQPELDDYRAVLHEPFLEIVDLLVGTHPDVRRAQFLHAFDQHPPVPEAVEDGDVAARRNGAPEAPQVWMRPFVVAGRAA